MGTFIGCDAITGWDCDRGGGTDRRPAFDSADTAGCTPELLIDALVAAALHRAWASEIISYSAVALATMLGALERYLSG